MSASAALSYCDEEDPSEACGASEARAAWPDPPRAGRRRPHARRRRARLGQRAVPGGPQHGSNRLSYLARVTTQAAAESEQDRRGHRRLAGDVVELLAHDDAMRCRSRCAASGRDIVSGALDGSVIVTRDNGVLTALPTLSAAIDAVGFLPDGRVVVADARRHLRLYDVGGATMADFETKGVWQLCACHRIVAAWSRFQASPARSLRPSYGMWSATAPSHR